MQSAVFFLSATLLIRSQKLSNPMGFVPPWNLFIIHPCINLDTKYIPTGQNADRNPSRVLSFSLFHEAFSTSARWAKYCAWLIRKRIWGEGKPVLRNSSRIVLEGRTTFVRITGLWVDNRTRNSWLSVSEWARTWWNIFLPLLGIEFCRPYRNQSFYWLRGPAQHCSPLIYRQLNLSLVATVRTKQEVLTFVHNIYRSEPRFRPRKEFPLRLGLLLTVEETDYVAVDMAGFINNRNRQANVFQETKYLQVLSCEGPIILPNDKPW